MGIFNEHSSNQHQFAKRIQGAPEVGFNLTSDENYDIVSKKLTNVADGTDRNDAVTKKKGIILELDIVSHKILI